MQVSNQPYQKILEVVAKVVFITNVVLGGREGKGKGRGKKSRDEHEIIVGDVHVHVLL